MVARGAWIIKKPPSPEPHKCKTPTSDEHDLQPGEIWECYTCGQQWKGVKLRNTIGSLVVWRRKLFKEHMRNTTDEL